jgi:hypothetical protein
MHIQLHLRICCNLVDTEAAIISQFSPSGFLLLFQLVSLSRQDAVYISVSATGAGPDATTFFVANIRENIGPLSDTLTGKCGEVLLFP